MFTAMIVYGNNIIRLSFFKAHSAYLTMWERRWEVEQEVGRETSWRFFNSERPPRFEDYSFL